MSALLLAGEQSESSALRAQLVKMQERLTLALRLGLVGDVVDCGGPVLSMSLFEGRRLLGTINVWPETKDTEERWSLSACCDVMPGLPVQAEWLSVAAQRLRYVVDKLLTCDWCGEPGHESEHAGCVAERAASDAEKDQTPRTAFDHREDL